MSTANYTYELSYEILKDGLVRETVESFTIIGHRFLERYLKDAHSIEIDVSGTLSSYLDRHTIRLLEIYEIPEDIISYSTILRIKKDNIRQFLLKIERPNERDRTYPKAAKRSPRRKLVTAPGRNKPRQRV